MKVNAIKDQHSFGSRVRLQNELVYNIANIKNRGNALINKVKQLENNGNDDLVILSLKTEYNEHLGIKDYISMEVYEKHPDGYYVSEDSIDAVMTEINENGTVNVPYYLNNMYRLAKSNVTKLVKRMDKFIPYL